MQAPSRFVILLATAVAILLLCHSAVAEAGEPEPATEFCLQGEFDLGVREQGLSPGKSEAYPMRWCVVTEPGSHRVRFAAQGKSNPDMDGSWMVAFLPPDTVRIVNQDNPPDVQFNGTENPDEARRVRRMDPRRLLDEWNAREGEIKGLNLVLDNGRLTQAQMMADMPLKGRVPLHWNWAWDNPERPQLQLDVAGDVVFKATGQWRQLGEEEQATLWQATPGAEPVAVPGDRWPARIDMRMIKMAEGVHMVRGVRTGFQHLVVETDEGLVIADAPTGWVELYQLPPADLVPGLEVSGLSQLLIDFLAQQLPSKTLRAVALTHHHDDHAGGARAFAAAGAEVFAPAAVAGYLEAAFNAPAMPADRLRDGNVTVTAVKGSTVIGTGNRVKLIELGGSPHVDAMLGVWAIDSNVFFVSDVHVPRNEDDQPREARAATECWFARWAAKHLPADVGVANTHSEIITPVSRLAKYQQSDLCQ